MKLQEIRPVRSIDLAATAFFKPSKNKTRRGLNPFHSKLEDITGASKGFEPRNFETRISPRAGNHTTVVVQPVRITRVKTLGKNRFHAVGVGPIEGNFEAVKSRLKSENFTGYVWMGKTCQLN